MNPIAGNIAKIFTDSFSSRANMYFSPGRINLIGEHIDYNDGFVLPAAINKGIYFAVAPNQSSDIHFCAVDFKEWLSVNLSEIKKRSGWSNYVLSVVNEFLLLDKKIGGFDCVFGGDIPRGSGMSSSAAVEGGLAFAINDIFNCGLNRTQLALLCQRAEHGFPNVKCGIMDQYANMLGKKDYVILLDCKNITHQYLPLQLKGYKIVMLNSKVHHSLAGGEYNVRRKQCEAGLMILKEQMQIDSFRDIQKPEEIEAYKGMMGEEVFIRCQYVVSEILRTQEAALLLQENDLAGFGKLMFKTHEGLSKLYNVSCKELDFLAEQAKLNPAVLGARMMGGGFGGCTINIVKEEAVNDFIEETNIAYQKEFQISHDAYVVDIGDGAGLMEG
jgi:galactokinase